MERRLAGGVLGGINPAPEADLLRGVELPTADTSDDDLLRDLIGAGDGALDDDLDAGSDLDNAWSSQNDGAGDAALDPALEEGLEFDGVFPLE